MLSVHKVEHGFIILLSYLNNHFNQQKHYSYESNYPNFISVILCR